MISLDKLQEVYEAEYRRQVNRNSGHMTVKGDPHQVALLAVYDFGYEEGFERGWGKGFENATGK